MNFEKFYEDEAKKEKQNLGVSASKSTIVQDNQRGSVVDNTLYESSVNGTLPNYDTNRSQFEPISALTKSQTAARLKLNLKAIKSINSVTDILGWEKRQDYIENKLKTIRDLATEKRAIKQKDAAKKMRESEAQKKKREEAEAKAAKNRAILEAKAEAKRQKELEAKFKSEEWETQKANQKSAKEFTAGLLFKLKEDQLNEAKTSKKMERIEQEIRKKLEKEMKAKMLAKQLARIENEKLQKERQIVDRRIMAYEDAWSRERMKYDEVMDRERELERAREKERIRLLEEKRLEEERLANALKEA